MNILYYKCTLIQIIPIIIFYEMINFLLQLKNEKKSEDLHQSIYHL